MNSREVFFNDNGLLRSGWRFAIFAFGFVFVGFFLGRIVIAVLVSLGFTPETNRQVFFVANGIVLLIASLFVGWICAKYLEHLPFRSLGASFSKRGLKNLLLGMLIGAAELALAVAIAWAFGGLSFDINLDVPYSAVLFQLVATFAILVPAAAWEEAFARGYMLQTFNRSGLALFAVAFTSILFGVGHYDNPSATRISICNTILAGVMFAFAYLRTRDLWFPFGMHLMWNWMQGAVFGIEVSGLNDIAGSTLLKEIDRGPVWLTGETYGIEGGIACTISLVVAIVLIRYAPTFRVIH